jgi:HEAT repeat protein
MKLMKIIFLISIVFALNFNSLVSNASVPQFKENPNYDIADGLTYKDLYRDYITTDQKWSLLKKIRKGNPDFARKVYLSCIESLDWFLRSGGLQFLASLDPELARPQAIKMLNNDPALMVRSAALGVLEQIGAQKHKTELWSLIKDAKNFHRGHSLWIRKDIAKSLFAFTSQDDADKWVSLLDDKDEEVIKFSIKALEKVNKQVMGTAEDTLASKAELWRQKYNLN